MIFFYSISLIIICAAAISPAGIVYMRTRKPVYICLILLFLCYIIELSELHYIAFHGIPTGQVTTEDLNHISYPALRITISFLILLLDLLIVLWAVHRRWKNIYLLLFIPLIGICTYLTTLPQTEFVIWLFYSMRQFYHIGYCAFFCICSFIEQDEKKLQQMHRYSLPMFGMFLLNISIMLEDSLVISHIEFFLSDIPCISERNFSENFLWIFACIYSMYICIQKICSDTSEVTELIETPAPAPENLPDLEVMLPKLAEYYKFTPREVQILECLITCMNTQEICEKLYISSGTAKTHIHNIYSKTNVSSKTELLKKLSKGVPQS